MKFRFRFGIRGLLFMVFLVAISVWTFGPPSLRVRLGRLEEIPSTENFAGGVRIPVRNYGPLPVWYRYSEFDNNFMVARKDKFTGKTRLEDHRYAPWTALRFLEKVDVCEEFASVDEPIGIQIRDVFGIETVVWAKPARTKEVPEQTSN